MKQYGGGEETTGEPAQPTWPDSKSSLGQVPRGGPSFLSMCASGKKGSRTARARVWQRVGVGGRVLSDKELYRWSAVGK